MVKNYLFEIWRDIKGFEGLYQVSNLGRVRTVSHKVLMTDGRVYTVNEKILTGDKSNNGYLAVHLWYKGKSKHLYIHRLVAETFIPNPNNLPCINHKDEDKTKNCVDNLEWCSYEYNANYGTRTQRIADRQKNNKRSKRVLQYDLDGNLIREWPSLKEIWREMNYTRSIICKCCQHKPRNKTAYGYRWEYAA